MLKRLGLKPGVSQRVKGTRFSDSKQLVISNGLASQVAKYTNVRNPPSLRDPRSEVCFVLMYGMPSILSFFIS